jgi:hypothetical protein
MARYSILSTLVLLILAASLSGASIRFEATSEPTPGLPGYNTYTLRAISDQPMQGFDFAGDGSNRAPHARGIFVHMNQVNPFGTPTVYSDNNAIINQVPSPDPNRYKQDSQFIVRTGDVVVPAGFAEESSYHLQGIWAHAAPVGLEFDIARLVIQTGVVGILPFRGVITTLEENTVIENHVGSSCPFFGECTPPQVIDSTMNAAAHSVVMHAFTATDADTPPEFLGWTDFVFNGPGTAIQPTFDPETQAFRWDTMGSRPGTYTAMVTAWNFFNSDTGTLTVHLVPESAGIVLALLSLGGVCIVAPRYLTMPAPVSRR